MQIGFTLSGNPMGKERPRMYYKNGRTYTYTPEKTRAYENNIRTSYLKTIRHKFPKGVPLEVNIIAFYPVPKRVNQTVKKAMLNGDILPTIRPDGDNIIKIILDALNKVAFYDDSQICKINFTKRYGLIPKVVIKLNKVQKERIEDV